MTNYNFTKFCICKNFQNPVPTKWSDVKALMNSAQVKNTCKQIAALDPMAEDYAKAKQALKERLPQLTVHACLFDSETQRTNEFAHWNGLVCLDYDHLTPEEIEALRTTEPPCPGIIFASRSCSGQGVFFIVEVPNCAPNAMRSMINEVHDAYTHALKVNHGLDISQKIDIRLDLARCRYLPPADYIWWDMVTDFETLQQQQQPYRNMYGEVIDTCAAFDTDIPEGSTATNTYTSYAAKVKKSTTNQHVMLKYLPDLGLSEDERKKIIAWTDQKVTTKTQTETSVNLYKQPIDAEALPLPFKNLPKLMQQLIKPLPIVWQRSAAICLLPALSAAAGALSQQNGKPLVFQVALWGEPQSGKTEFSAKPATIVQKYISRDDNTFRRAINKRTALDDIDPTLQCPKVLPFVNSSTTQVMKYLRYANQQTVMAYEGDLSSSLAGKDCAFLNLKSLLRCGFDGEPVIMDYKDKESFQGSVEPRLSGLVVGTPATIFNYFNAQSTAEGNARRVIFVEHENILKNITTKPFTQDEITFIHAELDYLQSLPLQTVYNAKIEQQAALWRKNKQDLANQEPILWRSA